MYKLDPNSSKFTELLKSHEFSNTFTIHEQSLGTCQADFVLLQSTLKVFINNSLELSIPINSNFAIRYENLSSYEICIWYLLNDESCEMRIKAKTLMEFTEWLQAFVVSKRPGVVDEETCGKCGKQFYLFRRKYFCKMCGLVLCSQCCTYKVNLPNLAYTKKQDVCKDCIKELRISGSVAHGSLVLPRTKIERRSVLE